MYVTLFVVALVFVIMFHEFGHYATAKLFGMKVERFFLGFGPTLWSFRRGETEYGVKAIPAGGFVRITGMSAFEDVQPQDAGRTFHEQAAWKRAIVLAAGSASHFVVAAALVFTAFAFVGGPRFVDGQPLFSNAVGGIAEGSPADAAGLRSGDVVTAVDGLPTPDFESVRELIVQRGGQTVPLTVRRDGRELEITAQIAADDPAGRGEGYLGVFPQPVVERLSPGEAAAETLTGELSVPGLTRMNVEGLARAFSPQSLAVWLGQIDGEGPRAAEGPISLVGAGQVVSALGDAGDVFAILLTLASINVVLALLNMLPLPPLDGGHLAVLAVEESVNGVRRLRGAKGAWRLNPAVLTPVTLAVILFFVVLSVTALYIDIVRPASELIQ